MDGSSSWTTQAMEQDPLAYWPMAVLFELEHNAGNEHYFKLNSQSQQIFLLIWKASGSISFFITT